MPHDIDKDRTELFTVVGAPYVPEQHNDDRGGHLHKDLEEHTPEAGVAWLWLIFYGVIIGASLIGQSGVTKAFQVASAFLNKCGLGG